MDSLIRKVFVVIFSLILFASSSYGQSKVVYLPVDSLLKWFENAKHPFHVWDSIRVWELRSKSRTEYDYKSYYQAPALKPHLLKWLDRDLYYQEELQEIRDDFEPKNEDDSAYIAYKIRGWITSKKRAVNPDSILHDSNLYTVYKDSVINQMVKSEIERMEKLGRPFPPSRAINFHMYLAYPESYEQIRQFWEATGKQIERNDYFIPLVRMGDPEARKIFNELIADVVKKNGDTPYFSLVTSNVDDNLRGSYGVAKLIELLNVDMEIALSEGPSFPINCDIIATLVSEIFYYKIEIDPSVKFRETCETRFEHVEEIKAAAQRLIEYYKEQEYYWMRNMPFYEE